MRKKGNRWLPSHLNACCGRLGQGHSNNHRFELKLSSAVAKLSGSPLLRQALVTVPSSEEKHAVRNTAELVSKHEDEHIYLFKPVQTESFDCTGLLPEVLMFKSGVNNLTSSFSLK